MEHLDQKGLAKRWLIRRARWNNGAGRDAGRDI
jgi:hypothetical protein